MVIPRCPSSGAEAERDHERDGGDIPRATRSREDVHHPRFSVLLGRSLVQVVFIAEIECLQELGRFGPEVQVDLSGDSGSDDFAHAVRGGSDEGEGILARIGDVREPAPGQSAEKRRLPYPFQGDGAGLGEYRALVPGPHGRVARGEDRHARRTGRSPRRAADWRPRPKNHLGGIALHPDAFNGPDKGVKNRRFGTGTHRHLYAKGAAAAQESVSAINRNTRNKNRTRGAGPFRLRAVWVLRPDRGTRRYPRGRWFYGLWDGLTGGRRA